MNILLTSLMVPGAPTGVRVHYERLAEGLRAQGHRVTVVTQDNLPRWIRRSIGGVRRGLGLVAGRLGHQIGLELGFVAEIYFAIDRREPYDVVNAQDVSSGWAARLALPARVPVVVTGHFNDHPGEEIVQQLSIPANSLTERFLHRWYNFLLRRTRYFLGTSDYVLRRALPWLDPNGHHVAVHNGADLAAFAPPRPYAPPAAGPDLRRLFPGRSVILNIGQLERRKNQQYLVQLAAELRQHTPDFVVVLVGLGEDEAHLRRLVAEQGLQREVVLLGYHRHVAGLLHGADVYVHTATRENCPYVLVEAMAAQCPAVALVAGGSPELLAATPEASIPQTTTPAALARQLHGLLAAPDALLGLQQRQYAHARQHFTVEAMLAKTLAFFETACQHQAGPLAEPAPPPLEPHLHSAAPRLG
ncbi:MAG TPA: glycosyltransferase family 4 protein [Hymenobacter sp.]|jgi:glycosyltransferase involved in cell wall biosynthesis|uniref:glycosyltransferase family 4 protein n=1 Tax=Hymenobacter sp. TaxID=1898978 RepID=UPI002ED77C32